MTNENRSPAQRREDALKEAKIFKDARAFIKKFPPGTVFCRSATDWGTRDGGPVMLIGWYDNVKKSAIDLEIDDPRNFVALTIRFGHNSQLELLRYREFRNFMHAPDGEIDYLKKFL